MGNYADAIEVLSRAITNFENPTGDPSEQQKAALLPIRANALRVKANAQNRLGQYSEAVESYRQAAQAFKLVGDKAVSLSVTSWKLPISRCNRPSSMRIAASLGKSPSSWPLGTLFTESPVSLRLDRLHTQGYAVPIHLKSLKRLVLSTFR